MPVFDSSVFDPSNFDAGAAPAASPTSIFDPAIFDVGIFDVAGLPVPLEGSTAKIGDAEPGVAQLGQIPVTSSVTITPGTGALNITGQAANLRPLIPQAGTLAITGQQPDVRQQIRITPGTGSLNLTGQQASAGSVSDVVSGEYVGDGAASRSFASAAFVPIAVVVMGKDGSGNLVGAIKTDTMLATKSQPFQDNQAAGAASRSNRITSLDANGFTVGADLNVTGRSYAYVMFPAGRRAVVSTGVFTGTGGSQSRFSGPITVGATSVTAGASFADPEDCDPVWYRPSGSTVYSPGVTLILAGRRIIRNSDGAVIAELTHFNSNTNCDAIGYITGVHGAGTYHQEQQYIHIPGIDPDMIMVFAEDTAQSMQPYTVVPPSFMSNTNASWGGTGAGILAAFFSTDSDNRLNIYPDQNFLTKGIRYHWIAFKSDEAGTGIRMATFTYTSDGSARSLTGLDFAPEWAWVFGSGNSDFTWGKKSTAIIGGSRARHWRDGNGDELNYNHTFVSDGMTIPAGPGENWNNNGTKYTVLLIVADPQKTAITPSAGSLALTGQTPTLRRTTFITPQTGSLIITPKNPIRATKRLITPNTATLQFTGKAAKTKETHSPGPPPKKFHETPDTGELNFTGRQPRLNISIRPGTGALTATGQKPFVKPPDVPIYTQTGALSFEGQIPRISFTITPGTGALALTGEAGIVDLNFPTRITINTGTLGFVGQRAVVGTSLIPETGELQLQTFNTEPIVLSNNVYITPRTGDLSISGVSPATNPDVVETTIITPDTGVLIVEGQPVIVERGNVIITPGTGSLILTGYQPIIIAPTPEPIRPIPKPAAGGVGLPHPRKLPFWPVPVQVVRGRVVEPAASVKGTLRADENELEIFMSGAAARWYE